MTASRAVFAQPKSDVTRSPEGMEFVSCDLCGMDDTKQMFYARDTLLGGPERYAVVRCQNCGLAYLNPRPTRQAIGRCYPTDYYDYLGSSGIANTSRRRALKNLLYHLTGGIVGQIECLPPGTVLDVGCGDGRYMAFFRDLGWDAYGVEPSAAGVERARSRGVKVGAPGELLDAKLPARHFDLVVMRYTIENMHNPSATLREARRVLKDGGKLFVCAPSIESPVARIFTHYCAYIEAPRHLYFFSPRTLPAMLERNGFRVVKLARVAWPALLSDLLDRLGAGRYRRFFARPWVSRGVWLAGAPLGLLLAYVGLNRGNVEIIGKKDISGE